MQRKRLEDMNLLDDFLFNAVMTFPGIGERFCRLLLQVVLGREIGRLQVVAQRAFGGRDEGFRGARLDVLAEEGLRLFATYVMAHHTYLNGEIWSAYGMGKAALFMADRSYPISMTYIHCMMAVCAINRKHKQEAQEEMLRSWELAKMDGFLEPFIEHHGLLRGLIEACIRNRDPEAYQRITEGVISFSRGWMALHNPENRRKVTGELSTMEFSIAMLASGGWTNKEIGEHLGISINTVKHYLTDIFCKLNVKKRDELKKFMLK